ncbi:MAG: 3-hydroxyacyl-CoA dehydrogenase family protein [Thermomicrobiales bacterium]|nr:3-hydroxyacyl-CoA dehydrogenase family protein [Thermomicrobiales bacterium]
MGASKRIAVVGSGTMGMQISALAAAAGYHTTLYDLIPAAIDRALDRIDGDILPAIVNSGMLPEPTSVMEARSRLITANTLEGAVTDADIVVEAIKEDLEVKLGMFEQLNRLAPNAILSTNSSSLPSRPLTEVVDRPERLLNTHFFAPVWERSMVELMTCGQTSEEAFATWTEVGEAMGLVVARVQGESKGFIINRVWRAIKRESLRVVDEGHGTPEDVDRLFRLFFGAKTAPFQTMDLVGLDVVADIEKTYHAVATDPADVPIETLTDMVEAGTLGQKTGRGFYTYPNPACEDPDFLKPKKR